MQGSLAAEIHALRAKPMAELKLVYRELFGEEPRTKHREFLWRRIAWRLQEQAYGGLTEDTRDRIGALIEEHNPLQREMRRPAKGKREGRRQPGLLGGPGAGTILTREYKGRQIEVTVVQGGFEYEGRRYRSLSAVAKAITGAHWNGPFFFGLR